MVTTIIGSIKVKTISGGIVNFGNLKEISPIDNVKENNGSGSGIIGTIVCSDSGISIVNSIDSDVLDRGTE